jgi:hypothetical protein
MGLLIVSMKFLFTNRGSDPCQLGMFITIVIIRSIEVLSHSISSYLEIFYHGLKLGVKALQYSYNLNYNNHAQLAWGLNQCWAVLTNFRELPISVG